MLLRSSSSPAFAGQLGVSILESPAKLLNPGSCFLQARMDAEDVVPAEGIYYGRTRGAVAGTTCQKSSRRQRPTTLSLQATCWRCVNRLNIIGAGPLSDADNGDFSGVF